VFLGLGKLKWYTFIRTISTAIYAMQFIFSDLTKLGVLFIICASIVNYLVYPLLPPSYITCFLTFMIYNVLFGVLYFFIIISSKEKQLARSILSHCREMTLSMLKSLREKIIG